MRRGRAFWGQAEILAGILVLTASLFLASCGGMSVVQMREGALVFAGLDASSIAARFPSSGGFTLELEQVEGAKVGEHFSAPCRDGLIHLEGVPVGVYKVFSLNVWAGAFYKVKFPYEQNVVRYDIKRPHDVFFLGSFRLTARDTYDQSGHKIMFDLAADKDQTAYYSLLEKLLKEMSDPELHFRVADAIRRKNAIPESSTEE